MTRRRASWRARDGGSGQSPLPFTCADATGAARLPLDIRTSSDFLRHGASGVPLGTTPQNPLLSAGRGSRILEPGCESKSHCGFAVLDRRSVDMNSIQMPRFVLVGL